MNRLAAFRPCFRGGWPLHLYLLRSSLPTLQSDLSISWNGVHAKNNRSAFTGREERCESITWDEPEGWRSRCIYSTVVARLPKPCSTRRPMRVHSFLTTRLRPPRGFSSGLIAASCILLLGQALVIATVGHRTLGPLVSDVTQFALGLICILACTAAFRRSRGIARYAWRLLSVAFVVWAVAQGLAVYVDVSADHSPDSLADILFFLSVVPFGMLTFLDPDTEPNCFDRLHILDFVQVCIFAASIFLCFSPRMWSPAAAFRIGHFTWSRNIAFDGLLVVTFVLRALLTKSKAVRWLFGRMALFLLLSGLADSYALSPGQDLQPGGWFDLIWSALLGFPILIAAMWKNSEESQADGSPKSQSIVVNQVFPLVYPLISFFTGATPSSCNCWRNG